MPKEIIFSYSGGMFPYYLGIAEVLQEYDLSDAVYSGTSGGCFAPLVLNAGKSPREVFEKILLALQKAKEPWERIIKEFIKEEFTEEELMRNNRVLTVKLCKLNPFFIPSKVTVDTWKDTSD